jgi:arylformamidase
MTLYDLSLTITEDLPTWPGDPGVKLQKISQIKEGGMTNLTHISTSVHVGTHIDAPNHFLDDGETVENIPLDLLVGPAEVIELATGQDITADDLRKAGVPGKSQRLLFKTINSNFWAENLREFQEDFIALDAGAAAYLVECGVEVVGIDYLSIAPYRDLERTHRILLEAGVLVIEGLNLSGVEPGPYTLLCLPLKIGSSDGAPARVLLQGD